MTSFPHAPIINTPEQFETSFPEITVGFNWQRFKAERWPIRHLWVCEIDTLLRFHTFFRWSFGRVNGHFLHWLGMRQMPIGDVLAKRSRVPQPHLDSIAFFARTYGASGQQVELTVPTFALPHGGQYIMDFNHRLCGLALSGAAFRLSVFSIAGPLSKDVLKDATHCRTQ